MKRIFASLIVLLCLTGSAWGATRKVQYVDTDVVGGTGDGSSWTNAYATMSAWEAQNTGLVVASNYLDVYCSGTAADTTACTIGGWTTSATCYITIQPDPNDQWHAGIWNANIYRLVVADNALRVNKSFVTLDHLQVQNTTGYGLYMSASNQTVKNCIVNSNGTGQGIMATASQNLRLFYNNIVYGACDYGISVQGTTDFVYNNTVTNTGDYGIQYVNGIDAPNGHVIKNNLIKGATTACYSALGEATAPTTAANYTSDDTSPDNGIYDNATMTFVEAADFHLAPAMSGTLLGVDLSGTFTTDIDGETRDSWYAGADELISSSGINQWWWRRRN